MERCLETLNYEETAFNGKTLALTLEPGCYRLITSMRMPNGDQQCRIPRV